MTLNSTRLAFLEAKPHQKADQFYYRLKLSVSAFLRFLDVRKSLKVLEVLDIVLEQQVAFFGQFFWVDLFLLGKKLVGVINQSCWGIY